MVTHLGSVVMHLPVRIRPDDHENQNGRGPWNDWQTMAPFSKLKGRDIYHSNLGHTRNHSYPNLDLLNTPITVTPQNIMAAVVAKSEAVYRGALLKGD